MGFHPRCQVARLTGFNGVVGMVILAALSLSFSSLFFPAFVSLFSVTSGLLAVMERRCTGFAGMALSVNFLPLIGFLDLGTSQDWLVTRFDLRPYVLTLMLLVVQMVCVSIVIWRWAFPIESVLKCRSCPPDRDL